MVKKISLLILGLVVAGMVYIRLAPIPEAAYFQLPTVAGPGDKDGQRSYLAVRQTTTTPEDILAAVEAVAASTPRTRLLTGSVEKGRMVFVTRTLFWGFPDITTVGFQDGLLVIFGRARYGKLDLGVNKARVQAWLEQLGPLIVAPE